MQIGHAPRWAARAVWLAVAMLLAVAGLSAPARGNHTTDNVVVEWNKIATAAIFSPTTAGGAQQPPHAGVLSMAMVQGAVYDAVNAIDGGYLPYLLTSPANATYSKDAAAVTAAYCVLVGFVQAGDPCDRPGLFPGQRAVRKTQYDLSLGHVADGADGPAMVGGIAVGEAAAAAMLDARVGDGRFGPFTFPQAFGVGDWRNGPPQSGIVPVDPAPWVGFVRPFLFPNLDALEHRLRTDGPNVLTSEEYAEEFNEVKELGSLNSTTRTGDQTAAAIFWQDNGIAIWNRVYQSLATNRGLDVVDSARLFAMTNLAGADASIGCWNDKAFHSFWRPITAIRDTADDGNPATEPDPSWVPLFDPSVPVSAPALINPGFPDHPSGHTCISSAIVNTLQEFFGTDKVPITVVSNKCVGGCPNRSFERLSLALKEIIDARVWGGIHFRTADVQGSVLGKKVAHFLDRNYFQPVI